ncbi:MAG: flippase [Patescibacteria group bacterium]
MIKSYSFSQNTLYLMLAYIVEKLLVLFYFIFLARYLGPEEFGIYSFAISFVAVFSVFLDLGFSTALVRETAKAKERTNEYLNNLLTFKFITTIFTIFLIVLTINLLNYPPSTRLLIYLATFWIIFESFAATFYASIRGWQNLRYESIGLILNKLSYIFLGFIFILLKLPLITFIIPLIIGGLLYLIYPIFITKKFFVFKPILKKEIIFSFFKISLPLFFGIIFSILFSYINTILVSYFSSDLAAGLFSAAFRIPSAILFLPAAFGASIFPVFSSLVKEGNKERLSSIFKKVFFYLTLIAIPITFGGIILGREIIHFIYGHDFIMAVTSFRILIAIILFTFLDFLFSSLLTAFDKQTQNTIARGVGLIVNIFLSFLLIPRLAHLGGAIALAIGFTTFFIIQTILVLRIISINFFRLIKKISPIIFSSLIMCLLVYLIKERVHLIFSIFFGLIFYFLTLYLSGGIKKEDLKEIKSLIRSSLSIKTNEELK